MLAMRSLRVRVPTYLASAAALFAVASLTLFANLPDVPSTYGHGSRPAAAALLVPGVGLAVAAVVSALGGPAPVSTTATALAGMAWLASVWVGWNDGPPLARSLAMLLPPLLGVALLHVVVSISAGPELRRWHRRLVGVGYVLVVVVSLGRALFHDPRYTVHCWPNCVANSLLVTPEPDLVRQLEWLWTSTLWALVVGVTASVLPVVIPPDPRRDLHTPAVWLAIPAAIVEAVHVTAVVIHGGERPELFVFHALFVIEAGLLTLLSVTIFHLLAGQLHRRRSVRLFVEDLLSGQREERRTALARRLGDERVEVGYWLPSQQQYVDARGEPMHPVANDQLTATAITRQGDPVAVIVHRRGQLRESELLAALGPAARLALENERMQAEAMSQLSELRKSRARVVAAADQARRRLERDLHDGAQQRLLAVSFELRLAADAARAAGNEAQADALAQLVVEASQALAELREVAHGIFPAILDEAGLDAALQTLADESPVPMMVESAVEPGLPKDVKAAVYHIVAAAADSARSRSNAQLTVRVARLGERLVVTVTGDVAGRYLQVEDRVGAVGGTVAVRPGVMRAELPCGSS